MLETITETITKSHTFPSYFYDGNLLLAEKVGSQITKIYINDGQGIVGMVRPIYDGSNNLTHYQRLYYLYDSLGSVSAVTGEHGLPLQNYTYSPFGTCLNVTNDPINNLQFVGRYGGYLDNDTGLTYFWHRWYDSKDGRFISRDPESGNRHFIYVSAECSKSNKAYQEISNIYLYALNSPQVNTDITGLFTTARCVPKDIKIRTAYLATRNICYGLWGIPPMPADLRTYSPSIPGLIGRLYNCGQKPDETKYLKCLEGACLQFCGRGEDCKFY